MKVKFLILFPATILFFFTAICGVYGFEDEDFALIEPQMDLDFVVLQNKQSTTITADLSYPLDFGIIPVALIGNGTFSASFSRTSTHGELIYLILYGFGVPETDINVGFTPISIRVNSSITKYDEEAYGVIIHGILFSLEDPPYDYRINLSF